MGLKITTKGFIELFRGSSKVSQHTSEAEALERASLDAEQTGSTLYVLRYPNKEIDLSRLTWVIRDIDVTRPTTPSGFGANPISATQINLLWTASTDPQGATNEANTGVAGYRVYRNGSLRTTTSSLSFSDTGLTEYTVYSYYVTAIDGATPANESIPTATLNPRTLDQTAPSAPVITASSTGQTTIAVALTTPSTDAHSGVLHYRVEYKRSADSTWTVASGVTVPGLFPLTISGLTAGTSYDTRCRATDGAGNIGNFSATSTVSTAASTSPPVWTTVPTISFTQGVASSRSITSYVSDPNGDALTITKNAVALPSGVTYNQSQQRYEYDGVGALGGTNGHVLTADDATQSSAEASWALISANTSMKTRFDTQGEVTDYRLLNSAAGNMTWDTTRKWFPTGSLRFSIPDSETGAFSSNWFRRLDDSFGLFTGTGGRTGGAQTSTAQGFDPPMTFEFAFSMYVPAALRNTNFPGGGGWKFGMCSHDSQSNADFEVVWQNSHHRGYPHGYHRNPASGTQPWALQYDPIPFCGLTFPDTRHQTEIDHGANALTNLAAVNPDTGLAWSDCDKWWARYGGTASYGAEGYPNAIGAGRVWKYWEQLDPTGASIGPVLLPVDDWMVFKVRVDFNSYTQATNRIRWYAARRFHSDWQLLADQQNALLPSSNTYRFNACWFTFFNTGRTSGGGVSTFANIGWALCRRDGGSVPFPTYWPQAG